MEKLFNNFIKLFFNNFGFNQKLFFFKYTTKDFESFFYSNNLFLGNLISFYKGDIITRASKSMNLAYNEFEFNELNYF